MGQKNYRLHRHRIREHINRADFLQFVASFTKILQIPCQSCAVAAYVNYPVRLHFDNGRKQGLVAAFSRRVYYNHVSTLTSAGKLLWKHFLCFSHKKFRIIKSVQTCILFSILNGSRNDLHAPYHLCLLCKKQRNCSNSAVKIPHSLISGKLCIFQCFSIKTPCLIRIYLKKGQRRNLIGNLSDLVCNVWLSPEQPHLFPKDHIISLLIHIYHHTDSLRNLTKGFHQSLFARKLLPVNDQTDHHLVRKKAISDQHMAH